MKTYLEMMKEISSYVPSNEEEKNDQKLILQFTERFKREAFDRSCLPAHFSASAMVFNLEHTKVLFAFHKIYRSYGWLGGHSDNEFDLAQVAYREVLEETGLSEVSFLSKEIQSVEVLTVQRHRKNQKDVPAHLHLNVTYAFEIDEKAPLSLNLQEHDDLRWIPLEELERFVSEKELLPIYRKMIQKSLHIVS